MLTYDPPIRDMNFALYEWLGAPQDWRCMEGCQDLDTNTVASLLEEAGRFTVDRLVPINLASDIEGCRFHEGRVETPTGFKTAYRAFVEGGWPALSCAPGFGGQGVPSVLNAALYEMLNAGSHAWSMYPGLAHGAYQCLKSYGTKTLQEQYLPKIVSGEWLATMCLTEPHAGSDLGLLRTKATPSGRADEESFCISGRKIFISGGAHDLTENIVHLVLARLPDSPEGSRGISLFLVPQRIFTGDDVLENRIQCEGIEHKMGIRGSATCSLVFEEAKGWLIGQPHRGLAAMFMMMNAARLSVALQGLGASELAYQNATAYAHERRQMRAPVRDRTNTDAADPIASHPAIQAKLDWMRALVEGSRTVGYWIAHLLDMADFHSDEECRTRSLGLASFLTPIAKAFFTDNGFAVANEALQIFGGHGYIRDTGIEQLVRDSRVAMVYEGTNEIQAIDLIQRKLIADKGTVMRRLLGLIDEEVSYVITDPTWSARMKRYRRLCVQFESTAEAIMDASASRADLAYRVADDFLKAAGLVVFGYAWCKTVRIAGRANDPGNAFYQQKLTTGRVFFDSIMPDILPSLRRIHTAIGETGSASSIDAGAAVLSPPP